MDYKPQKAKALLSNRVEQLVRTDKSARATRRSATAMVVKVHPSEAGARPRNGGDLRGKIRIAAEFDAPLSEMAPYSQS